MFRGTICLQGCLGVGLCRSSVIGMQLSLCGLELDKVMQLLKQKGIELDRARGHLDAEEVTKSKLFAKYERRKKRQTERHVLRRSMAIHPIPRLFVSQRADKNPNGFNCAICRKDISFLWRGELEIWRHFGCKTHFVKDQRYRLDHEDTVYTAGFDEIAVPQFLLSCVQKLKKRRQ